MKKTLHIFGAIIIGTAIYFGLMRPATAAPGGNSPIVFSAVARDADGFVRTNETLYLDCRLVDRDTRNTIYSETHTLSSDAMGQLQIPLGDGTATYGDFQQVDFSQPLDLMVYDGDRLLTDSPLTKVPSAAFAQTAAHAATANSALSAQTLDGIAFDDEAEPDQGTIWSSAKVAKMLGNGQGAQTGQTALAKERIERIAEDQRIWDTIDALDNNLLALEERVHDTVTVVWDTIDALKDALQKQKDDLLSQLDGINHCLVNDAEKGIYRNAIPLYDKDMPDSIGMFTEPLLKVLRQDGNCYLVSNLNQVSFLGKSYRARVMTYNTGGDPTNPKEVYIPASTAGLTVYVDNYRIDEPVTYYTYDALVFDVEFYYLGDDITPKLYVTLIRE